MLVKIPKVRIYVITYKRPNLLKRAITSIQNQSYKNWIAEVINDDINDEEVNNYILSLNDSRIFLSTPQIKRGGTGNFNYAFSKVEEPFACILEDDNWYEPSFLQTMVNYLIANPNCEMAVANENIWKELPNNKWQNTLQTIWDKTDGIGLFSYHLIDKCGSAKICNSSMVWKTENSENWKTPNEIPIDVTEHFRERVIPHPILLVYTPLVNYAVTINTFRKGNELKWSIYQTLLVTSIFNNLNKDTANILANDLWLKARTKNKLLKTLLLNSSLASKQSRILLKKATILELLRYFLTFIRRPLNIFICANAMKNNPISWRFLIKDKKQSTNHQRCET